MRSEGCLKMRSCCGTSHSISLWMVHSPLFFFLLCLFFVCFSLYYDFCFSPHTEELQQWPAEYGWQQLTHHRVVDVDGGLLLSFCPVCPFLFVVCRLICTRLWCVWNLLSLLLCCGLFRHIALGIFDRRRQTVSVGRTPRFSTGMTFPFASVIHSSYLFMPCSFICFFARLFNEMK